MAGSQFIICPDNFTNFIDKCVLIPTALPNASTYGEAVASCLAAGRQILNVSSLVLAEGIRSYLQNSGASVNLWIRQISGIIVRIPYIAILKDGKKTKKSAKKSKKMS